MVYLDPCITNEFNKYIHKLNMDSIGTPSINIIFGKWQYKYDSEVQTLLFHENVKVWKMQKHVKMQKKLSWERLNFYTHWSQVPVLLQVLILSDLFRLPYHI